ncbi:MAG: TIGR03862 family flavoprotein [Rhodoferax sp.]|nr:TIGR03862 family flavoprotein [Rhodoferax sp.]
MANIAKIDTAPKLQLQAQTVLVIGGGPAGLMAAQTLQEAGFQVHLMDAMPSVGRKFLLAGKGGLNLTHSEPLLTFVERYGAQRQVVHDWLVDFGPAQLRAWALQLGVSTFVGSSGRVFPVGMKAAPLLRTWLARLRHPAGGFPVQFHMRHRWTGWADSSTRTAMFDTPLGMVQMTANAVVLALGGGSWAHLGSNGAWVQLLAERGVDLAPLLPVNCGFDRPGAWSPYFKDRFAGLPFKSVAISIGSGQSPQFSRKGEFVATATGVEGSLIYAASGLLRTQILQFGSASFQLDLLPDIPFERVFSEVGHPRGSRSLSSHLKSRLHLDGIKMAILHELLPKADLADAHALAKSIKSLTVTLASARPIDEAISSAGGVRLEGLTPSLMLERLPGVFCAGEMLDWEAPTGGYLLTACFASGRRAGLGASAYLGGL